MMPFAMIRQAPIARQILFFVSLCLVIAELLIFIPSATQFQHRWFATQWQHFLMQFEPSATGDLPIICDSEPVLAFLHSDWL